MRTKKEIKNLQKEQSNRISKVINESDRVLMLVEKGGNVELHPIKGVKFNWQLHGLLAEVYEKILVGKFTNVFKGYFSQQRPLDKEKPNEQQPEEKQPEEKQPEEKKSEEQETEEQEPDAE